MFIYAAVFGCLFIALATVQVQVLVKEAGVGSQRNLSRETVQRLKSSISDELQSAESTLEIISETEQIADLTPEECQNELETLYSQLDTTFLNLSRMNTDGVIDCNTYTRGVGTSAEELPHLQEILNDPDHNAVLGPITQSIQTEASQFVSMHVPIFSNNGAFRGSVGSSLRLDDLNKQLSEEFDADFRGTIALIDDNGDIIYHSKSPVAGRNIQNGAIFTDVESQEILAITMLDQRDEIDQFTIPSTDTTITYGVADVFDNRNWYVIEVLTNEEAVDLAFHDTFVLRWVTLPPVIVFGMFATLSLGVLFGARYIWRKL